MEEIKEVEIIFFDISIVSPSVSPWAAPVVLAKKDGTMHFCIDYRKLNSTTKKDSQPLPCITEALDALGGEGCKILLDTRSLFWLLAD